VAVRAQAEEGEVEGGTGAEALEEEGRVGGRGLRRRARRPGPQDGLGIPGRAGKGPRGQGAVPLGILRRDGPLVAEPELDRKAPEGAGRGSGPGQRGVEGRRRRAAREAELEVAAPLKAARAAAWTSSPEAASIQEASSSKEKTRMRRV